MAEQNSQEAKRQGDVYVVTRKTEVAGRMIQSNAAENEDKFQEFYLSSQGKNGSSANVIEPPYFFKSLREAARENATLAPCVSAMEVNIDGTGFYFVDENGEMVEEDDERLATYKEFTDMPYPQTTFLGMRRLLRRDAEETGNYFIEVLRNNLGEIIFARRVAPEDMRMCRLSEPVEKTVTVKRGGVETQVTFMARERRFAQVTKSKLVYFAEFGASRRLDKETGVWEGEEAQKGDFDPSKEATEIIHGVVDRDSFTPYGVPRWISSKRAVRGQVESEELNNAFFDSGGLPPVLVTVTGGELTESARDALRMIFSGKAKDKLEGAVVEATSVSGTIDKEGSVGIQVHQFGDNKDAMFGNYDEAVEAKIRKTFRLPKLFMGDVEGVNFATAYTMYMVTETQVFEPERLEFDTLMNQTIFADDKTFKGGLKLKSKPLNLKNVENRMKAVELAVNQKAITKEQMIDMLNMETGLSMQFDQDKLDEEVSHQLENNVAMMEKIGLGQPNESDPVSDAVSGKGSTEDSAPVQAPAKKSDGTRGMIELIDLASTLARAAFDEDLVTLKALKQEIDTLTPDEFFACKKLCMHNLAMNQLDENSMQLIFPELASMETD